jgi:hypothetical protein
MIISRDHVETFDRDGYAYVEGMFTTKEVEILLDHIERGERIAGRTYSLPDEEGRKSSLAGWADIRDDVYGAFSSNPRLVTAARLLLHEDAYHWYSKVMLKEPRVGGAWEWHQDYGHWYTLGCMYPRMISCMIALDAASRENGCLKVIPGSHHVGRLDHGIVGGGQYGLKDPLRVRNLAAILPPRYVEAAPGSVLFFHGNLLHSSEPNLSERPRRAYICCYNAFSNVPVAVEGMVDQSEQTIDETTEVGQPVPVRLSADDAILRFEVKRVIA